MEQQFIDNLLAFLIGAMILAAVITTLVGFVIYIAEKLTIIWGNKPYGAYPVQADGFFLDYYFYFRARYDTAKIEFSTTKYDWEKNYITKEYILYKSKDLFAAGYISYSKARRLIYWGCFKFLINRIIRNIKDAIK